MEAGINETLWARLIEALNGERVATGMIRDGESRMIATRTLERPKLKRGRPASSSRAADRDRHIEVAGYMLGTNIPVRRIAAMFEISRPTAYRWLGLALTYKCPKARALRRLFEGNPPAESN